MMEQAKQMAMVEVERALLEMMQPWKRLRRPATDPPLQKSSKRTTKSTHQARYKKIHRQFGFCSREGEGRLWVVWKRVGTEWQKHT